jgi:hypothetical protein
MARVKKKPKKTLSTALRTEMLLREELEQYKKRCQMLRKLRDVRIIEVREPNGNLCAVYTVPTSSYEKKVDYFKSMKDELKMRFNQDLTVEVPVICDTMISLESEINSLNDVAEESEM